MTIKQFRTLARKNENYETIPVDCIKIVSDIHNSSHNVSELHKSINRLLVIVHKNNDNTYSLITGWKDYVIAVRDNIKEINAVLVEETSRDEFLYNLSTSKEWVNLDDIHIPNCFKTRPPKKSKLTSYTDQVKNAVQKYNLSDYLDNKPIVINKDNVLIDGYTRYLALQKLNYKDKFPVIRKCDNGVADRKI